MSKRTILVWFRNDLRIRDNEMLSRVVERGERILPVYCFDPRYFNTTEYNTRKTGLIRTRFIRESVLDLMHSIRSLGGELVVRLGYPEEILPELASAYGVDEVYHHREVASEETAISAKVEAALWELKLNLRHFIGHTLYHKEDLPFPVRDIPDSFSIFKKKTERESSIRPSFSYQHELQFVKGITASELPSFEALGFSRKEVANLPDQQEFVGGESRAQERMEKFIEDPSGMRSGISPWLSLGCISIHEVYFRVHQDAPLPVKQKSEWLLGLWWHDYYRFMFKKHGNRFFQPNGFRKEGQFVNHRAGFFDVWRKGQSDDENVNRIMKTLNNTGFITNDERRIAAGKLIDESGSDWLAGAAYFEEKLIDYNPANNYGWWAHLAGVGSSQKHNRPIKQAR